MSWRWLWTVVTCEIIWTACWSKTLERRSRFQVWVLGIKRSATTFGRGEWVTGRRRWLWIESQMGHQGEDQIEELPPWIWYVTLVVRSFLIWRIEDQKMEGGPSEIQNWQSSYQLAGFSSNECPTSSLVASGSWLTYTLHILCPPHPRPFIRTRTRRQQRLLFPRSPYFNRAADHYAKTTRKVKNPATSRVTSLPTFPFPLMHA